MTDNNSTDTDENETEDGAELASARDVELTIGGEESTFKNVQWDLGDDNQDALALALQGITAARKLTGTITLGSGGFPTAPEMVADVTLSDSEGNKHTIEKGTIKFREQVREEARELRENAPREQRLGGATTDIDDVIEALHEAKERGIDEVYVNDDAMTRRPDPRITNNHVHYHGGGPKPGELEEWVEL